MIASKVAPLTGKRVFGILIGFFGIITAVNMVFLYVALSTHPGADTEDAYRRGVAYNAVLDAAAAQKSQGWLNRISYDAADRILRVALVDARGRPVRGLRLTAEVRRTVKSGHDFALVLAERRPGEYQTSLVTPLPGQWQVRLSAHDRSGGVYLANKTIWSE